MRSAEQAAVGQVNGKHVESAFDFDIDMLDEKKLLTPVVKYESLANSSGSCHKRNCTSVKDADGNCPKICELLKKIDSKKGCKCLSVTVKMKTK